MKKADLNVVDIEELACVITDLDYDDIDADTSLIEEKLYEEYQIESIECFTDLINTLLPLISLAASPLTKKLYKGFADTDKGVWLAKVEYIQKNPTSK